MKGVSKQYAGSLIERARKIQTQWIEASNEDQTTGKPLDSQEDSGDDQIDGAKRVEMEERRGPLTADHFREALRRYKLERDSNGVGVLGLGGNRSGVERFGLKAMGRRLLR
jgi:transcription initiation factor TFIID subunit 11